MGEFLQAVGTVALVVGAAALVYVATLWLEEYARMKHRVDAMWEVMEKEEKVKDNVWWRI